MKRIFLSVAILAAAASCSKSVDVATPQGDAIGFSTLNDRVTKVANTNDDGKHDNYQVYANISDQTAWLFSEQINVADNSTGTTEDTFNSNKVYYWPGNSKTVDFYAYAPKTDPATVVEGSVVISNSEKKIPLTFTVPDEADTDFTVATPITGASYNTTDKVTDGLVALQFAHMLSKASMTVVLETSLKGLTLTFKNATFAVDNNIVKADAIDQSSSSEAGVGSYTIGVEDASGTAETKLAYNSTNDLFFAPQTGAGCSITLNNVVVKSGDNVIFTNAAMKYDLDDATHNFERGTAYNFAITVDPGLKVIRFSSTEADWNSPATNVVIPTPATTI